MNKKKALQRDFYMEVKKSRGRFLSIFLIVALGVAFLSGIRASEPDMRYSGDAYFDKWRLMDIQVLGTLGLTDDDVEAIQKLDSVEKAEGTYSTDVLCDAGEVQEVLHVMALLPDMNLFDVSEGRLPEKKGECLVDIDFLKSHELQIGDTITLHSGTEDPLTDTMVTDHYTIVGAGSSCRYISFGRGSSLIGTGEIEGFLAVIPEAFDMDVYTEICVMAEGAKEATSHTEEYDNLVERTVEEIEAMEDYRCQVRYEDITGEAKEKLEDAKRELADGKKEAGEKLKEAEEELRDGEEKLLDGEKQTAEGEKSLADGKRTLQSKQADLAAARKQYESGMAEYQTNLAELNAQEAEFNRRLPEALAEIEAGEAELAAQEAAAREQLAQAKQEINTQLSAVMEAEAALPSVTEQLTQAEQAQQEAEENHTLEQLAVQKEALELQKAELEEQLAGLQKQKEELEESGADPEVIQTLELQIQQGNAGLEQLAQGIAQVDEAAAALEALPEQIRQLTEIRQQLTEAVAMKPVLESAQEELKEQEAALEVQLQAGREQLNLARQELKDIQDTLQSAKGQLTAAGEQLAEAKAQIDSGQVQIDEGFRTLAESEVSLQKAKEEIAESRKKLEDGRTEYEEKKLEAEQEIRDGEQKIEDAEAEIADIKEPSWYVNDRSVLPEYTGYGENADRMRAIGQVFPVLFFLVAALISLTTMTRMVEEQRTQIGTLKALGYSKLSIAGKYLSYALLATIGGSLFGVLFGEKVFPFIIIYAYKIMYKHIPDIVIPYNLTYAVIATAAAVFCTTAATLFSCYKELAAQPAVLMRPPAPKQGKRIILERIPFLWKRMNFTWKSTFRNLIRYKKRFFMTIIGIGGCMALMLVGFGLKDSIMDVARLQYREIQTHSASVFLKEDVSEEEKEELLHYLDTNKEISGRAEVYLKMITVKSGKIAKEPYLCVAADTKELEKFTVFRSRQNPDETYTLPNDGVILTEKLANMLNVEVGDTFIIQNSELGDKEVKIAAVCENYMGHYIYMSGALYEKLYGTTAPYNGLYLGMKEYDQQKLYRIGEQILGFSEVQNVTYTDNMEERLNDMLRSLNLVIVVLIVSAGALAFIVLYNLNNINITERKRELATIKVLGFYDGEVAAYVYRENVLLTLVGAACGCVMGWLLHQYVIVTVEVEEVMFGRNINFQSYLYSLLFTIGFSIIVNLVMYFKLKKIDMVESLKSIE